MNKLKSATTAVLLCFLLALALSACGTSGSTAAATTSTGTSNIQMSVASGNQQVTVSWTDPSNPSGTNATYNVYCSGNNAPDPTKTNDGGTLIASNTTSPFVHTGLTNGNTYYYFVTRATGSSTFGQPSLAAMAVPQAATPAAPTDININTFIQTTNNLGAVTLTIPNADPTLTYNVYWSTTTGSNLKGANGTTLITNAFTSTTGSTGTTATFTHSNLAIGTTYYYAVTAVGDSESAASQTLTATPVLTQFTNYSASATGPRHSKYGSPQSIEADVANQAVTITWTAPSNTTGTPSIKEPNTKPTYNLYYWASTGSKSSTPQISNFVPNSGPNNSNSLTINTGLTNGTAYDFCVTAVQNVCTDSTCNTISSFTETQSAIVSVMPQTTVLAVPSAVSASAGDQQVSLSWASVSDPSGGAVKYNVYCLLPTSTKFSLIGTTTTNSFVHSGLTTGNTYFYYITSVSNQAGESAPSNQVAISL